MTRVLVVEDDPQLVRALVITLRARGYDTDAAPDGATAIRRAAARPRTPSSSISDCPT